MSNTDYKRAASVELYDVNVVIRHRDHDAVGISPLGDVGYQISSHDIERIAAVFGLDYNADVSEFDVHIRHSSMYEEDNYVDEVYARIDAGNLLSFRTISVQEGHRYEREFSYAGAFSVEWWQVRYETD